MTQETQQEHPDPREPQDEGGEVEAPDVEELEQDPAHEPDEEGLKDLKGG